MSFCSEMTKRGTPCRREVKHDGYCSFHYRQTVLVRPATKWQDMVVNNNTMCDECFHHSEYVNAYTYQEQFYTLLLCLKAAELPLHKDLKIKIFDFVKPKMHIASFGHEGTVVVHLDTHTEWRKACKFKIIDA